MKGSEKQSPEDLRKNPRMEIPEQVAVKDAHSGETVGQLVNLSVDGLMLMNNSCVEPGTIRQLRIPLTSGAQTSELSIGAECLWCQDANDSGSYWSGFHIIDISSADQKMLSSLVGD